MAQHFIKDSVIDSGSDGSCNAENIMGTKDVINGKGKIFGDYYVCGKKDHEEGGCKVLDFNEWSEIWRNCKEKDGDKCYNAATIRTPGVKQFHMGACSDGQDRYDPENNVGGAKCGVGLFNRRQGQTYERTGFDSYLECKKEFPTFGEKEHGPMSFGSRCGIGEVHGVRPAYPTQKGVLTTIGNRTSPGGGDKPIESVQDDSKHFEAKLNSCPRGFNDKLICYGDGFYGVKNGYGCGMGSDVDPQGAMAFCKRPKAHFSDKRILQCCLGEMGSVRTDGKADSTHIQCPRDYCRTNIEFSKIDADEQTKCVEDEEKQTDKKVCYKLSNKCNERLKKVCDRTVFFKERSDWKDLLPYCNTWAISQPSEFKEIASEICKIPYDDTKPENNDLSINTTANTKKKDELTKIFTNRLCRDYIELEWDINKSKIENICQYAVEEKTSGRCYGKDKDLYPEKDIDQPLGKQDSVKATPEEPCWQKTILGNENWAKDICPCFYPEGYFRWYKNKKFNKGDTTSNIASSGKVKPECYMPECQRTLLYDKSGKTGGCPGLQVCTQSIEQKVINLGNDNLSDGQSSTKIRLPRGGSRQKCNFSSIVSNTTTHNTGKGTPKGDKSSDKDKEDEDKDDEDYDEDDEDYDEDDDEDEDEGNKRRYSDDDDEEGTSFLTIILLIGLAGAVIALLYFGLKKAGNQAQEFIKSHNVGLGTALAPIQSALAPIQSALAPTSAPAQ